MKNKAILFLVTLIVLFSCSKKNRVTSSTKIDYQKSDRFNMHNKTKGYKKKKNRRLYIVYSDRSDNQVFRDPYAQELTGSVDFLTPFYVINQKNNFFELVEFQANQVGKPKTTTGILKNGKRHFIDGKQVKYIGWVHKNNLLHFDHSQLSASNYQPKRKLLSLCNKDELLSLSTFIEKDTISIYSDPSLSKKIDGLLLNQILFPYKYNIDKSSVLVSNYSKLPTKRNDSTAIGWISTKKLCDISQKQILLYDYTHSLTFTDQNDTISVKPDQIGYPLIFRPIEDNIYPSTLKNENKILFGVNVWNHKDNKIINLLGEDLLNDDIISIDEQNKTFNINLLFDCSSNLRNKERKLLSSMQRLQVLLSRKGNYNVNYAVSSYGCDERFLLKRTNSFDEFMTYLQHVFVYEDTVPSAQKNSSLLDAVNSIVPEQESFENNLIMVIGAKEMPINDIDILSNRLAKTSSRVFFYQLESDIEEEYQNFTLQAKDLLAKTALAYEENLKAYNVEMNLIQTYNTFINIASEGNYLFVMDSPENSSYQGAIAFTGINSTFIPEEFDHIMDSLVSKTIQFNKKAQQSRKKYITEFNFLRSKVEYPLQQIILDSPSELKLIDKRKPDEFFFIKGNLVIDSLSNKSFSTGYLFNDKELSALIDQYRSLIPTITNALLKKDRKAIYKSYLKKKNARNKFILYKKFSKESTLAELFFSQTGIPVNTDELHQIKISQIKRNKELTNDSLKQILHTIHLKLKHLESIQNTPKQYFNLDPKGNNKYFFIPVDELI